MAVNRIFKMFGWGDAGAVRADDNHFPWDELPLLPHLKILEYLDRRSLNNMRQTSWSTRELIETVHGIHVIIPARTFKWTAGHWNNCPKLSITDSMINYLINQMEGMVIRTLDITEIPSNFNWDKNVQFPARLRKVNMKYCDVSLVHEVFSRFKNLQKLEYCSGIWRPLPYGPMALLTIQTTFTAIPVPAVNGELWTKINAFPQAHVQPQNLQMLTLVVGQMCRAYHSDWATVIWILLALPVLPSLKTFHFSFLPNMMFEWKIHLLIISCLAEFLGRGHPNLKVLRYESTYNTGWGDDMVVLNNWKQLLRNLIEKYGSESLKEIGNSSDGTPPVESFMVLVKTIMRGAGRAMGKLDELSLTVAETKEHELWGNFVGRLPADTVKICRIMDTSRRREEPDVNRRNVYKILCSPIPEADRLAVYGSLTCLSVHCTKTMMQRISISMILRQLPRLKELELEQGIEWIKGFHPGLRANEVDLEEDEGNNGTLEKLLVKNLSLSCENENALKKLKRLRELSVVTEDEALRIYVFEYALAVEEMVACLGNLRNLEKVTVRPLFVEEHGRRSMLGIEGLEQVGQCERLVMDTPHVTYEDGVYGFTF